MKVFHIRKPNGKMRTIYAPSREERAALRALLPALEDIQRKVCLPRIVHGFAKGRSCVTNARAHRGRKHTLCMDLSNFFDTVTRDKLDWVVPVGILREILVDGAARQGLPTSPAAANIAAARMDTQIDRWCKRQGPRVVYTRYADDLAISTDDETILARALEEIPSIVERLGFKVAVEKTHLYHARDGRRIVTGVSVDKEVYPTRAAKRRLRAARHQGRNRQAAGLAEWCSLKLPKAMRTSSPARRLVRTGSQRRKLAAATAPRRRIVRATILGGSKHE